MNRVTTNDTEPPGQGNPPQVHVAGWPKKTLDRRQQLRYSYRCNGTFGGRFVTLDQPWTVRWHSFDDCLAICFCLPMAGRRGCSSTSRPQETKPRGLVNGSRGFFCWSVFSFRVSVEPGSYVMTRPDCLQQPFPRCHGRGPARARLLLPGPAQRRP